MPYVHTKEEHKYNHYNNALGCKVESKEHYDHLMKKGGYVSLEEGQRLAEKYHKEHPKKEYKLGERAKQFIRNVKQVADKKGNVYLNDKAIAEMKAIGVNFGRKP